MIPTEIIKSARVAARLTQEDAAKLLGVSWATWTSWETGRNRMHPCFFELFKIKTGQHRKYGNIDAGYSDLKNKILSIKEHINATTEDIR